MSTEYGYSQEWMTQALQSVNAHVKDVALPAEWKVSPGYAYTGIETQPGISDGFGISVRMVTLKG